MAKLDQRELRACQEETVCQDIQDRQESRACEEVKDLVVSLVSMEPQGIQETWDCLDSRGLRA